MVDFNIHKERQVKGHRARFFHECWTKITQDFGAFVDNSINEKQFVNEKIKLLILPMWWNREMFQYSNMVFVTSYVDSLN